jgi:hypothetical protein
MDRAKLRPSPALVVGSAALVVALSGSAVAATGVSHTHYKTNSIPSRAIKSLKANKVKGTVKSAKTAKNALRLGGLPPAAYLRSSHVLNFRPFTLTNGQTLTIARNGPLSIVAWCTLNPSGDDQAGTYVRTTQDHSFMDVWDENADFGPADATVEFGSSVDTTHGNEDLEANDQGVAGSPDGHMISTPGFLAAVNTAAFPGKCSFAGTLLLS